jgi:hypothetical protein
VQCVKIDVFIDLFNITLWMVRSNGSHGFFDHELRIWLPLKWRMLDLALPLQSLSMDCGSASRLGWQFRTVLNDASAGQPPPAFTMAKQQRQPVCKQLGYEGIACIPNA